MRARCAPPGTRSRRWIAAAASASPTATSRRPAPPALAGAISGALHNLDVRLLLEPGRWLVGPTGVLLAGVVLVKQTAGARFVVLDAAMNDLIRPAMYEAWHGIVPLSAVDAVGPVASGRRRRPDMRIRRHVRASRALPPLAADARVAILDAGAYGSVMSSTYNARPVAAEVLVDGDRMVGDPRSAGARADLWHGERIPNSSGRWHEPRVPSRR